MANLLETFTGVITGETAVDTYISNEGGPVNGTNTNLQLAAIIGGPVPGVGLELNSVAFGSAITVLQGDVNSGAFGNVVGDALTVMGDAIGVLDGLAANLPGGSIAAVPLEVSGDLLTLVGIGINNPNLVADIKTAGGEIVDEAEDNLNENLNKLSAAFEDASTAVSDAFNSAESAVSDALTSVAATVSDEGSTIFNSAASAATSALSSTESSLTSLFNSIGITAPNVTDTVIGADSVIENTDAPTQGDSGSILTDAGGNPIGVSITDSNSNLNSETVNINSDGSITQDVENSDGTSSLTDYNTDGSSIAMKYSGPNETGSLISIDQENADGTSQITTYNADGSSLTTSYSGPDGTGTVIPTSTVAVSDTGVFTNSSPSGATVTGVGTADFTWGSGQPSSLSFTGASSSTPLNTPFNLGNITYFNGTNTNSATSVDFDITANVGANSTAVLLNTPLFLDNTPNTSDPIASADTVSFGDTGFAFHVEEGDTVSANIYAIISYTPGTASYTLQITGLEDVSSGGFLTTLNIDGTKDNQPVTDEGTVAPFAGVSVADSFAGLNQTLTVTLSAPANGTLTNLGGGSYDPSTGTYTVAGTAAAVDTALDGLVFIPTPHQVAPGQTVSTGFTINDTDSDGAAVTESTTSVIATGTTAPTPPGFDGDTVNLTGYYQAITPADIFLTGTATVTPGTPTFQSLAALSTGGDVVDGSLTVSGDTITVFYPQSEGGIQFGTAPANTYVLTDTSPDAATIVGVTLSSTDIAGLTQSDLTFGAHNVDIDVSGVTLPTDIPGSIQVSVEFASAPTCFAAGTMIPTERRETLVEKLAIGDQVITSTGAPTPIKWIGHRHINCRRHPTPESVWPIRIAPHAFAENAPHSPLYLSPEHAVFTDGVLIPIRHLINGVTIAQEPRDEVTYYHIELPRHDVILAEGLPCESWLDTGNRSTFENAAITDLHPSFAATAAQAWAHDACAPLVEAGPLLEAVRTRLNARAGLPTDPTAHQSGPLHGWIDGATSQLIHGWAWQPEHPGHAARLEILAGETLLGEVLADEPRPDVRDAGRLEILRDGVVTGHGDGRCGFTFRLPTPLSPFTPHTIRVRRAADGTELWNSGQITLQPAARLDPAALAGFATALRAAAATGTEAERTALTRFIAHQADHLLTLTETATPDPRPLALFIDETLPAPAENAAAQAALDHMRSLQTLGYRVAFAAADPTAGDPTPLQTLGITTPAVPSVEDALRRLGPQTALVYLHRIATAARYTELVRQHCPNARLVYSVADLHFLRIARQAAHTGSAALAAESRRLRARELHAASLADRVITHSPAEAALLRTHAPGARVHVVPWSVPLRPTARPFQDRNGIAFIGGYRHAPNVDAAHWLINTIMPLVRQQDPTIECLLVGSHLPDDLSRITHGGIVPIGHAPDLAAIFDRVRLTVAPLRYGAGLKGKLLHSLAAGVPCIATPVAAEGLPLPPALQGCIGTTEAELAALILRLHTDERRNTAAAEAGLQMIRAEFATDQVDRRMRDAVGHAPMPAMQAARCHPAAPGHPAAAVA